MTFVLNDSINLEDHKNTVGVLERKLNELERQLGEQSKYHALEVQRLRGELNAAYTVGYTEGYGACVAVVKKSLK